MDPADVQAQKSVHAGGCQIRGTALLHLLFSPTLPRDAYVQSSALDATVVLNPSPSLRLMHGYACRLGVSMHVHVGQARNASYLKAKLINALAAMLLMRITNAAVPLLSIGTLIVQAMVVVWRGRAKGRWGKRRIETDSAGLE